MKPMEHKLLQDRNTHSAKLVQVQLKAGKPLAGMAGGPVLREAKAYHAARLERKRAWQRVQGQLRGGVAR